MSTALPIDNRTPFATGNLILPDGEGQEVRLFVLKATFTNEGGGPMRVAKEQVPVALADVPRGEPAFSSPLIEADIALHKPFVDVLVEARAYAPRGLPATRVEVELALADIHKRLVVHGDRQWNAGNPTRAQPFVTMPIIYERAFGGSANERDVDVRNPVGIGFHGARSADPTVASAVANVELPYAPIRWRRNDISVGGLGPLGRGWRPRINWAGTYDQAWLEERWPLRPRDYDPRHDQAAPIDQQSRTLVGGEYGHTLNLSPAGVWHFQIPVLLAPIHVLRRDEQLELRPRIDTVLLDPARHQVTLVARVAVPTSRSRPPLDAIVVGHLTRGILRAYASGRAYVDPSGRKGSAPGPLFALP